MDGYTAKNSKATKGPFSHQSPAPYRRNVVSLKTVGTPPSPLQQYEHSGFRAASEPLPNSPATIVNQSLVSKFMTMKNHPHQSPSRSHAHASNGGNDDWVEQLWESLVEPTDDQPVPNSNRCAAVLSVMMQLIASLEGALQEVGKKALKELCRCIYLDFEHVCHDSGDGAWFDNAWGRDSVSERQSETLIGLQPYFSMMTVSNRKKPSCSHTILPQVKTSRTVSQTAENDGTFDQGSLTRERLGDGTSFNLESNSMYALDSQAVSMTFQTGPQARRRGLHVNESRIDHRKLQSLLVRNSKYFTQVTYFHAWRTLTQDLARRRALGRRLEKAIVHTMKSKIWFVWRLYVQDQKRLRGNDLQAIMESFRLRLRGMKLQQDRLQMEKFQLEDRLQQICESKYIIDFTQALADHEGNPLKEGVVQFRELSPVEIQQMQLEVNSQANRATSPISPRQMEELMMGRSANMDDDDDSCGDGFGTAFYGTKSRITPEDAQENLQKAISDQAAERGAKLRPLVAVKNEYLMPFYSIEITTQTQYQSRILGNAPRMDVLIEWVNSKLADVSFRGLEMQDYGKSLMNGEVYLALLLSIVPAHLWTFPSIGISKLTDQERAEMVVDLLLRMELIERGEFIPQYIVNQRAEANQLLIAKLFVFDRLSRLLKKQRLASALAAVQPHERSDPLGILADAYQDDHKSPAGSPEYHRRKKNPYADAYNSGVADGAEVVPEWRIVNDQTMGIRLVAICDSRTLGTQTIFSATEMDALEQAIPALAQRLTGKKDEKVRAKVVTVLKGLDIK